MPFFSPTPAPNFYLDPGSGSIVFQMIVAALLGVGVLIRTQWSRLKKWFDNKPETEDSEEGG